MKKSIRLIGLIATLILASFLTGCGSASGTYSKAQNALAAGDYEKAAELFDSINSYEDSTKLSLYSKALLYGEQKNYSKAIDTLVFLGDYKDSSQLIEYYGFCELAESTKIADLLEAAAQFDAISAYRDSADKAEECRQTLYDEGVRRRNIGDINTARRIFLKLGEYKDSKEQILECNNAEAYSKAEKLLESKNYDGAIEAFKALGDYNDSAARVDEAINAKNADSYAKAEELLESKNYDGAIEAFKALGDYSDSAKRIVEVEEMKKSDCFTSLQIAEASIENGNFQSALDMLAFVRDFGISEFEMQIDNDYYVIAQKAYDIEEYDIAVSAINRIDNTSIIETSYKEFFYNSQIEDAYQKLTKSYIKDDASIAKTEELFSIIPENYKDVDIYKQIFDFYKPYVGVYKSTDPSQTLAYFRIKYSSKAQKWTAIFTFNTCEDVFEYPNLSTNSEFADHCMIVNTNQINATEHVFISIREMTFIKEN